MNIDLTLPDNLPEPIDDGAADHLIEATLPAVPLRATDDSIIDLAEICGRTVVYAYPMSGEDNSVLPDNWDAIPGARGCTPQHCSLRDKFDELQATGVAVYGLATQSVDYLAREVERLHLPYPLLSDENLELADAIRLPRFDVQVAGSTVLKRTTLIINSGTVEHVFYPVFPPNRSAEQVIDWLMQ